MNRRFFLRSTLAGSAGALGSGVALHAAQENREVGGREYYVLRRYHLVSGAQRKLTNAYFRNALVPGLNRLGISPVGVFNVEIGPTAPSMFVLLPSLSAETLVTADFRLEQDPEYMKGAADFLKTPAKDPAYVRVESSLMIAFAGYPKMTVPPVTANHGSRVFELRTYESSTDQDHRRK